MKNFFKQLLNGLQRTQQALAALEAAGVDVDRLIGISNAQGPQAKGKGWHYPLQRYSGFTPCIT
jgi:hypothetical protein